VILVVAFLAARRLATRLLATALFTADPLAAALLATGLSAVGFIAVVLHLPKGHAGDNRTFNSSQAAKHHDEGPSSTIA
jgi:NhaP-type Na+/H+ or K+/H+ antiporter